MTDFAEALSRLFVEVALMADFALIVAGAFQLGGFTIHRNMAQAAH